MGIREYDFDNYNDIENQSEIKGKKIQKFELEKNNQELENRICNKIYLCACWFSFLLIIIWFLSIIILIYAFNK